LVFLLENQRIILNRIANDPNLSKRTRVRALALLLADRDIYPATTDGEVAEVTGMCRATIATLRKRYASGGLMKAINPLSRETDQIELVMRPGSRGSAYFSHFASRPAGNSM
jgi:hypothetical protein